MSKWPYHTTNWLRLRAAHLMIEPLCRDCRAVGRIVLANHVDHIMAISSGGDPFPNHDGLASLCASCHGAKTSRGDEAGAIRSKRIRLIDGDELTRLMLEHGIGVRTRRTVKIRAIDENYFASEDG